MKNFLKDRFNFSSSVLFFLFLGFFQSPFFEYELGILTSYVNNFNALNEITFWSSFYGDSLFESSSLNPMKYNFIAWLLFVLSKFFSHHLVFTLAPIIFTALSFFFALKIFELYKLQKSWALVLAFLGMTSISTMPLLQSFVNLLTLNLTDQSFNSGYFDLLTSFSSSLVLLVFLSLLYLTLKIQIFKSNYESLLPLIWALSIFVHPSIFIFGYSFIVLSNLIQIRRMRLRGEPIKFFNFLFINILPLIFVIPYILLNISFFGSDPNTVVMTTEASELLLFLKAIFFYFVIPLGLMLLTNNLYKVDPFESFVRFWPILLIALIEILIRTFQLIDLLPINDQVILNRVSVYFLHFFYYVPFLVVLTRRHTYLPDINDSENNFLNNIRGFLNYMFIDLGKFIVLLLIGFVAFTTYLSIDHESYRIVNDRAQILNKGVLKISLDEDLVGKKIQFISLDERIISSFLFPNIVTVDYFSQQGFSVYSEELDFLEFVYKNTKTNLESNKRLSMLEFNFNKRSFEDNSRNLALLLWLKYNSNYYDISNKIKEEKNKELTAKIFFQTNYLISHESFDFQEVFFSAKSKQIGKYQIIYTK